MPEPIPQLDSSLDLAKAFKLAETSCIKGEESFGSPVYNEETKVWVFALSINATKEGCDPVCLVSTDLDEAEIKWRRSGVIIPAGDMTGATTNFEE